MKPFFSSEASFLCKKCPLDKTNTFFTCWRLIYIEILRFFNKNNKTSFFDNFWYFKLSTRITQEDENDTRTKGIKKSLNINIRDLSYKNKKLYDSTFLSFSYAEKKNEEFKNLDTFTKLSPPKEELDKCNSRFYNKINR